MSVFLSGTAEDYEYQLVTPIKISRKRAYSYSSSPEDVSGIDVLARQHVLRNQSDLTDTDIDSISVSPPLDPSSGVQGENVTKITVHLKRGTGACQRSFYHRELTEARVAAIGRQLALNLEIVLKIAILRADPLLTDEYADERREISIFGLEELGLFTLLSKAQKHRALLEIYRAHKCDHEDLKKATIAIGKLKAGFNSQAHPLEFDDGTPVTAADCRQLINTCTALDQAEKLNILRLIPDLERSDIRREGESRFLFNYSTAKDLVNLVG